jgi:Uma2 family endonuclease
MPDDAMHRELVHGDLIVLPPPEFIPVWITHNIYDLLIPFADAAKLGEVFIELGFRVYTDDRTWVQPDVSFIRADRLAAFEDAKYALGAPDLAVEVISPSESAEDVNRKVDLYLAAGSHEVWVVYPRTRTLYIHSGDRKVTVLRPSDEITSTLFPGWSANVSNFFGT